VSGKEKSRDFISWCISHGYILAKAVIILVICLRSNFINPVSVLVEFYHTNICTYNSIFLKFVQEYDDSVFFFNKLSTTNRSGIFYCSIFSAL